MAETLAATDRTASVISRSRLKEFEAYSRAVSCQRAIAVCLVTMAPSFGAAMLIELLPMAAPSDGWAANWIFWVRTFLSSFSLTFGVTMQIRSVASTACLSIHKVTLISIGACVGYLASVILIARFWIFPIPFMVVVGNIPWEISFMGSAVLVMGRNLIQITPGLKPQLQLMQKLVSVQSVLMVIYPVYNAVFISLQGTAQVLFVAVLPLVKFIMKRLMCRIPNHTETSLLIAKTTVDTFEALYLFKCMQAAGSTKSAAMLILVDLVQNVYHLWKFKRMIHNFKVTQGGKPDVESLLHRLSLSAVRRSSNVRIGTEAMVVPAIAQQQAKNSVGPAIQKVAVSSKSLNRQDEKQLDHFILECEEVLLIEYLECAVPLFYVLYYVVLYHLPNAKYYPEMQGLSPHRVTLTIINISVYAIMEVVSFIYMHMALRWQFNLSALHLLAFTLEKRSAILQGVFITWVNIVLFLTLEHNGMGADFIGSGTILLIVALLSV